MDRNQLLDLKRRINQRTYDMFQEICQQRCKAHAQRVACAQFDANGRGHEDGVRGSFGNAVLFTPRYLTRLAELSGAAPDVGGGSRLFLYFSSKDIEICSLAPLPLLPPGSRTHAGSKHRRAVNGGKVAH